MPTPSLNCRRTCPLDSILLDFIDERRQRAHDGIPMELVVGPPHPSVRSLLNPTVARYSHPLSRVLTDVLKAFPDLSGLPERVATLYTMFSLLRWQIDPTPENFERVPEYMLPCGSQLTVPHPAWIDHVPFPHLRQRIIAEGVALTERHRDGGGVVEPGTFIERYPLDDFFVPYTQTVCVNWPYADTDCLLQSPLSEDVLINPVFMSHIKNRDIWTLGERFRAAMPDFDASYNLRRNDGSILSVAQWEVGRELS